MRSSFDLLAASRAARGFRRAALPLAVFAVQAWSSDAAAHITLLEPPSWIVEGSGGDPQKQSPCGAASPGTGTAQGSATNVITTYEAGQTITVRWRETIYHPGHFRIALSADRSDFFDPEVQVKPGGNISESAEIMDPVAPPVLMDGLFPRTANNMGNEFSQQITLPDEPCEKCTLQLIQFMADHAPGYFYYHCADIKIVEEGALGEGAGGSNASGQAGSASTGQAGASMGGRSGSGGSSSMPAGSGAGDDEEDVDGGCSISPGAPAEAASALATLALLGLGSELWRRRNARR